MLSPIEFRSQFTFPSSLLASLYRDILSLELKALAHHSTRISDFEIEVMGDASLVIRFTASDFIAYKTAISSLVRYLDVMERILDLIDTNSTTRC